EFKRAINALGQALDPRRQFRGKILGRAVQDAAPLLINGVVFDLFGGNQPVALRHVLELQLPDRQYQQALVADDTDINLPAFDILFGDRGGADALVNEFDALDQLLFAVDDRCLRYAV